MPLAARKPCGPNCKHFQPCPVHGSHDQARYRTYNSNRRPDQKLYDTPFWRLRSKRFLRENPLCKDPDGKHGGFPVPATVVDHIIPHRGDIELFSAESNLQGLCKGCHSRKTLRETRQDVG
jgi:5-methylcytosine-specific restriction protein A